MRLYFDFISPYAYLAWRSLPAFEAETRAKVTPVPVLFAALLSHHGTKGPAEVPAKRAYVFKDANRKAHAFGLSPVVPPPAHPFNPLLALRVASLEFDDEALRSKVIDAFFRATWSGGGGVDSEDKILGILRSLGLAAEPIVARANADESKQKLRRQTEEALEHGVFGVPSLLVRGEVFWGLDALPFAAARWAGHDIVDELDLAQWARLPSGAERRKREAK